MEYIVVTSYFRYLCQRPEGALAGRSRSSTEPAAKSSTNKFRRVRVEGTLTASPCGAAERASHERLGDDNHVRHVHGVPARGGRHGGATPNHT
jgi:hypothetical protein